MGSMEFRDLKTQYAKHKELIDAAILSVVSDTHFIGGAQVDELESKLASYVGVKHCISCANGTDALQLALMAWGIGEGDVVFVPDFTFFSSGEVVPCVGATPVFVDVKEDTLNIDPGSLTKAIKWVKDNTELIPKVVIAVDLFGQPAEYEMLKEIASENGLLILEDAAQGFGGEINIGSLYGKACSFGDISTTSFFPAKPLGCYGDGGAIFTNNDVWAKKLRSIKVHGKGSDKYDNVCIGMNSRLDTIQAAILLEKLKFFDEEVKKCNEVASWYDELLKYNDKVKTPIVLNDYLSSWAQYTILCKDEEYRNKIMSLLKEAGIPSMIYYRKPMHLQEAFSEIMIDNAPGCPVADDICKRCLSLPMSAYLSRKDVEKICSIIV